MAPTLAKGLSPVRQELANGAVVLVQETAMTPAVTISATFRAGSVFDPPDLPGLAYLTGRVIDRGTATRSAADLADELDDRGVSLRVSTNRQALTISCTCLSEDFKDILAIIVDVARNPTFPEAEIEKRRSEALTVLRQNEDNPASRAVDGVLELLYTREHPYGRPSKGTAAGVERVSRADMLEFHRRRIRPGASSRTARPGKSTSSSTRRPELPTRWSCVAATARQPSSTSGSTGSSPRRSWTRSSVGAWWAPSTRSWPWIPVRRGGPSTSSPRSSDRPAPPVAARGRGRRTIARCWR